MSSGVICYGSMRSGTLFGEDYDMVRLGVIGLDGIGLGFVGNSLRRGKL